MKNINSGVYPTMITPYNKNHTVDYGAVRELTEWYYSKGCTGIFAACQSSEIMYLSLEDRVKLAATVKETSDSLASKNKSKQAMSVVASGHISESFEDQINELKQIAKTGVDAVVLITNRADKENTNDEAWIADIERICDNLPDVLLGLYECPKPYKRLLSDTMIKYIASSKRFGFIKDTCCDAAIIKKRLELLDGSGVKLFNANAQTLLACLRDGADGYCGVMGNFHPEIYVKLFEIYDKNPKEADVIQSLLCMGAFTESLTYPCTAKYYLNKYENIKMELFSRSADSNNFTDYQKSCIDQMKTLTDYFYTNMGNL